MLRSKFANNNTLSKTKREQQLKYDAKKKYGLSLEQARNLRKRPCEICNTIAKKMVIDHVVRGSYRGVLCQQCNVRLGWLESKWHQILNYASK